MSGKKPFLFCVYLSVWEQIDLQLTFPHLTVSESTLMQRLAERLGTEHAPVHSALRPGESELGAGGKGRSGREDLAPATHLAVPEF